MREDATFKVRVTGILLENDRILLVRQRISVRREWSLPGGTVELGETLTEACRIGGTIRIPPPEFEDNPISDVALFCVNQLQTIGFGSAFVHFVRSLDARPAYGMPFVGAKEAIGL